MPTQHQNHPKPTISTICYLKWLDKINPPTPNSRMAYIRTSISMYQQNLQQQRLGCLHGIHALTPFTPGTQHGWM